MSPPQKTRRYPRVTLPKGMTIAWQSSGLRIASRVRTLGMGGLFVSTKDPAPVGSVVRLIFEVPGGDVRARAVVRDSRPGRGMGVEFILMGYEDRARLARLLKRLLRDVA